MLSIKNIIKNNEIAKSIFFIAFCKTFSIILSYLYVPLAITYLGNEKYGIWVVFLNIFSWIGSFDLGIGNGLRNKLTEALSMKDREESKRLISSSYAFMCIFFLFILVISVIAAVFIDWNNLLNTKHYYSELKYVILICLISVSVNFVLSLCNSVLYALQESHIISFAYLLGQAFSFTMLYIFSKFSLGNLMVVSLIECFSLLGTNLITSIVLYSRSEIVRPSINSVNLKTGKELTLLGFKFFIVQVCALVLFSTDNLIISNLYGAEEVTPYSVVIKMYSAVIVAHSSLIIPFWSASTKAKTENDVKKLIKMIKIMFYLLIPFIIVSLLLTIFFVPIEKFWLHRDLLFQNGLIILGFFYCLLNLWCDTVGTIASGLNLMKIFTKIALIQAIVNIPLSLILAVIFNMKITGVFLGTIISMCISAVFVAIAIKKDINIQISNQ